MKKIYAVAAVSLVVGMLLAGSIAGTALAWEPKGKIQKWVQNVSTSGAKEDANNEATAVNAKQGDTLKYTIKVWNEGEPGHNGINDMVNTVMTDTLPSGVQLVSDPAKQELKETIARLKPGESKTFEYTVKVTKQDNGVIKNTACFVGNTDVNDNEQNGCDDANVKVKVEEKPTPTPTPTPQPKPQPQVLSTTTLPKTGPGGVVGVFAGVSGLGYALHRIVTRKR